MVRPFVLRLVMTLIVAGNAGDARGDAERCRPSPDLFKRFQASAPATPAPDLPFFTADGRERRLAELRGRGVVVNFWATWCAPCVEEMPALDRLRRQLSEQGVDVLALSSDFGGAKSVQRFYEINEIRHLEVLVDPKGLLARGAGLAGLPTTLLIDAEGHEVGRVLGAAAWDAPPVVAFVAGCLGSPARP
jgi:thiol-disulfide isomerase/thioredoxin